MCILSFLITFLDLDLDLVHAFVWLHLSLRLSNSEKVFFFQFYYPCRKTEIKTRSRALMHVMTIKVQIKGLVKWRKSVMTEDK